MLSRMPPKSPVGLGGGCLVGMFANLGSGGCPAALLPVHMWTRKQIKDCDLKIDQVVCGVSAQLALRMA